VLQIQMGWDDLPYQWVAAGYMGAINTGKTICGALYGATAFLGALHGDRGDAPSGANNARRMAAGAAVESLFRGFIDRFGATECLQLTGCDWTSDEDRARYDHERIYETRCAKYIAYALSVCLERAYRSDA